MNAFNKLVTTLSRLCGILAASMILLSVWVVCHMVVVRYGLQRSSIWQTEFVTYLLIAATFVGSPYVLLIRGHVNVDLLPQYLGRRGRLGLGLVAAAISLSFCLTMAWTGYRLWLESWDNGWVSDTIWAVPLWIPYLAMPIGFGILSLQYIADILNLLGGPKQRYEIGQDG